MRKTLVIAVREYFAAVKSKAFVISLVLMPVMMTGGIVVQRMAERIADTKLKKVAVIDRTAGETLFQSLAQAAEKRNKTELTDPKTGRQFRPAIELERIAPADLADPAAVATQRMELSERVRRDELFAFIEIGKDVLRPRVASPATLPAEEDPDDPTVVRYCTNRPTNLEVRGFLDARLPPAIYK
ncbi:MAG: hypothetical protein ACREJC_11825, partial [Tepidisphaeraceae bacterium]